MTGMIAAAREAREQGTFSYLDRNIAGADFIRLLTG